MVIGETTKLQNEIIFTLTYFFISELKTKKTFTQGLGTVRYQVDSSLKLDWVFLYFLSKHLQNCKHLSILLKNILTYKKE
jgi:hypothetical protein